MMRKVIFDCDNTFGMLSRDVDDGLTLLYLAGLKTVDLLGVTLSHGNGTIEEVVAATAEFKRVFQKGFSTYPGSTTVASSPASDFLVAQVDQFPQEITIIATGALTNLVSAQRQDPAFFSKIQQIILMGGTVKPLVVNELAVSELNFSSDAAAAEEVLLAGCDLTIMNGHMTAKAFFSKAEQEKLVQQIKPLVTREADKYLTTTLTNWIKWNEEVFHFSGFCNWDMTTAVFLDHPELFSTETYYLADQQPKLTTGQMTLAETSDYLLNMPKTLLDVKRFNQVMIDTIVAGFES